MRKGYLRVAVCCNVLQCVAAGCSVLQGLCVKDICVLQCVAVCCSVLQCVAVCCSVLQCVAGFVRPSNTLVKATNLCIYICIYIFIYIDIH